MSSSPSSSQSSPSAGPTLYVVLYVLPEPFDCEKLENSCSIEFDADVIDGKNAYKIKGFRITGTAENTEEMLKKANPQAERLVQIMTFKSLGYVRYAYSGYHQETSGVKTIAKELISRNHIRGIIHELNLRSNQKISSLMRNREDTNMQLYHFRRAIDATENGQYSDMYKELFQIIEKDKGFKDYDKYKALRDALSHQMPVVHAEKEVNKYFPGRYDFINHEFNHLSENNRVNLRKDAEDFQQTVIPHLNGKLQ